MTITLDIEPYEAALLKEALDSHIYWQLSDQKYRNNGFVYDPGSDDEDSAAEIVAAEQLVSRLEL